MFSFRTTPLKNQEDKILKSGRLAVLCNQVAWNPGTEEYLFQTLYRNGNLKKVFFPKGGLFDEKVYDEQERVDESYPQFGMPDCEFCSLDMTDDESIDGVVSKLEDIDGLIVEFQDLGVRYNPIISLISSLFRLIHTRGMELSVFILDRENPLGRGVEGTMLPSDYESPLGVSGLPHAHGLTLGEIANILYYDLDARFPLHIISYIVRSTTKMLMPWSISPFFNVPGLFTCGMLSGQYLWHGTNVSCGKGTLRPFEQFGAPFMKDLSLTAHESFTDPAVLMRRTEFIPFFDRYQGLRCYGFQLIPKPAAQYHSLAHQLRMMKLLSEVYEDFDFNDDLFPLLGDDILMAYLNDDDVSWADIKEHIKVEEQKWIRKAKKFLLYDESLWRVKSLP